MHFKRKLGNCHLKCISKESSVAVTLNAFQKQARNLHSPRGVSYSRNVSRIPHFRFSCWNAASSGVSYSWNAFCVPHFHFSCCWNAAFQMSPFHWNQVFMLALVEYRVYNVILLHPDLSFCDTTSQLPGTFSSPTVQQ